jgi:hypothetical protein
MILTPEEKAEWLDACAAHLAGEPIEFRSPLSGQWLDAINIRAGRAHRRKPAPALSKLVPLGPDDVLGCVLRLEGDVAGFVAIHEASYMGVQTVVGFLSYNALQYNGWQIHRVGDVEDGKPVWRRCEK